MNFKGCHCPHCKADMSEARTPQCLQCGRQSDPADLYAKRRYSGTIVLPAAVRRFGLPVLMILAGVAVFVTSGSGGKWIGLGFGYLLLSVFFDPFDR